MSIDPAATWRIQNVGDSNVSGWARQQSYRYPLWTKLLDSGISFDFVGSNTATPENPDHPNYQGRTFDRDHEGHAGWTVGQVAGSLPGWMASYVPDISLIHVGTNNILQQGEAGIESSLRGLTTLVQALRNRNPTVRIYGERLAVPSGTAAMIS